MQRTLVRLSLFAVTALAAPIAQAQQQPELIPLDRVYQFYQEGQPRSAARSLAEVSGDFRQEIGRCKDPVLGEKLMELEPRMDALIRRLAAGSVANASALSSEFAVFDQLLAENHLQLVEYGWNLRRNARLEDVGRDLELTARYLERSARWRGRPLDPSARETIASARTTASALIATPNQPPADAERSITALATLVRGQQ